MSTRSQVVIRDKYKQEVVFYRHSDGYPEGAMPPLQIFMNWVREGKIRDNAEQAAGWLIIFGAIEYGTIPSYIDGAEKYGGGHYGDISSIVYPGDWKCGAYEPATGRHGDIEFLYILDLGEKTISCYATGDGKTYPDSEDKLQFVDTPEKPWMEKKSA